MKMLLLSNSTMHGQAYFEWAIPHVCEFLKADVSRVLFIPFAGVTFSNDEYTKAVKDVFNSVGFEVEGIHQSQDMKETIKKAEAIMVGGGNTFHLISNLIKFNLIESIRKKVLEGASYIGWSAGANITCPTIKTTNDMPIIQPTSFDAMKLIPFQINPHYTKATIPNHTGESRDQRINEYLEINRGSTVVGLPEGTLLEIDGSGIEFKGTHTGKVFQYKKEPVSISQGSDISWLLDL